MEFGGRKENMAPAAFVSLSFTLYPAEGTMAPWSRAQSYIYLLSCFQFRSALYNRQTRSAVAVLENKDPCVHSDLRAGQERSGLIQSQARTLQLVITFLLWVELYFGERCCVAKWSPLANQTHPARESSIGTELLIWIGCKFGLDSLYGLLVISSWIYFCPM